MLLYGASRDLGRRINLYFQYNAFKDYCTNEGDKINTLITIYELCKMNAE